MSRIFISRIFSVPSIMAAKVIVASNKSHHDNFNNLPVVEIGLVQNSAGFVLLWTATLDLELGL